MNSAGGTTRRIARLRRLHSQLRSQSTPTTRHNQRSWTPHTRIEPPTASASPTPTATPTLLPGFPTAPFTRTTPWPGATPYARVRASPRQSFHPRTRGRIPTSSGGVGGGVRGQTWYPGGYFISYTDLERALERRGLTFLRVAIAGFAGLGCISVLMWPRIKRWGAAEGAEVAAASLQQEELKAHAAALVSALIADPSTAAHAEAVLKGVLTEVLADPELKGALTAYMADVMSEALMWPKVLEQGNTYVDTVLSDEASIAAATQYFSEAAQRTADDEAVRTAASRAMWGSLRSFFWGSGSRSQAASAMEQATIPAVEAAPPPSPAGADAVPQASAASVDSQSVAPESNKDD